MVSIIVAIAKNGVIGKGNDLPWYLPDDLKHFKELTFGHTVVMGRKTFESVMKRLGKPLPNRTNVVLTRDPNYKAEGAKIIHSFNDVNSSDDEEIFIIGGAQIYSSLLPITDRIYLTEVNSNIDGDTYFPDLNPSEWNEFSRENHKKDEKHQYDFDFVVLNRVKQQ